MTPVVYLDDVDQLLLAALVEDGRRTSRSLAEEVGLNEVSVGTRIRRLMDHGVLQIAPQFDWLAAGFRSFALASLKLHNPKAGAGPVEVGRSLASLPGVFSVEVTYGSADLFVMLLAQDDPTSHRLVNKVLTAPGVGEAWVDHVVDVHAWVATHAVLPYKPTPPSSFPDPPFPLDELDRGVIRRLHTNGRESNREIANRLSTSDATVRTRRKRLEDSGLMRLRALIDPVRTGRIGSLAQVGLTVSGDVSKFVAELIAEPWIAYCATTFGRHNVVCGIVTESQQILGQLLSEGLWARGGVQRVDASPLATVISHRSDLVRFL
jgi:Lrp/AsnC family transcriptional regulator for asnA, asnC and gidA